jgi:Zn-finger nucleic acid-binding protein
LLCPNCKTDLSIAERQGIEIDFCPQCRGVWLDRGELDKIIERSGTFDREPVSPERVRHQGDYRPATQPYERYDDDDYDQERHRGGRRRGWFGELFDFD